MSEKQKKRLEKLEEKIKNDDTNESIIILGPGEELPKLPEGKFVCILPAKEEID